MNLENFHQANKVFTNEIDENANITNEFYITQKKMYLNPLPQRHKYTSKDKPLYSIWRDKQNNEHKIDYVTSREFYCHFYERETKNNPDFIKLKKMIEDGYNLMIHGYDAYNITKNIEDHYTDKYSPFGHELVLYTMLVTPSEKYVWHKYKTFEY